MSTEEQRSAVLSLVEATDDWMYDEGMLPPLPPSLPPSLPSFSGRRSFYSHPSLLCSSHHIIAFLL